jgi:hypothetical protein
MRLVFTDQEIYLKTEVSYYHLVVTRWISAKSAKKATEEAINEAEH